MGKEVSEKELLALYEARKRDRKAVDNSKKSRRARGMPEPISTVLASYFREDDEAVHKIEEHRAISNWPQYVGAAAHFSRPLRVRNGTMTVHVNDPLWMQQLSLLKQQLLKHFQRDFPKLKIRDIYFTRQTY